VQQLSEVFGDSDLGALLNEEMNKASRAAISGKKEAPKAELASMAEESASDDDEEVDLKLEEFAKGMELIEETFENNPKASGKIPDWSANKRAVKNRIFFKHYKNEDNFEHHMTFKLAANVELRDVQIGFNNYWQTEAEYYVEPLSVLVQGGEDQENLVNICNLEAAKDDAFAANCVQVYGKNLRTFSVHNDKDSNGDLRSKVFKKLDSLYNFRCKYLKFSFRRNNNICCLDQSPIASRVDKKQTFSLAYISATGVNLDKNSPNMPKFCLNNQKAVALEAMSLICAGEYSSVLEVVANQQETITMIK